MTCGEAPEAPGALVGPDDADKRPAGQGGLRAPLPGRRLNQTFGFEDADGRRYDVTLGYRPNGCLGEIFLTGAKSGSGLDIMMRDAAIAVSLALQHGCPVAVLRNAFLREEDGRPAGPLAQVFDLLAEEIEGEDHG